MKKMMFLSILTITLTSIAMNASMMADASPASEQMGRKIVTAMQHRSVEEYKALFPSLSDFHAMMDDNANLYGVYLRTAKNDFDSQYQNVLVPALKDSFDKLIKEGTLQGIDWTSIEFVRVEVQDGVEQNPKPISIVFAFRGQEHRIQVDHAFLINGQWKLTQYARLK